MRLLRREAAQDRVDPALGADACRLEEGIAQRKVARRDLEATCVQTHQPSGNLGVAEAVAGRAEQIADARVDRGLVTGVRRQHPGAEQHRQELLDRDHLQLRAHPAARGLVDVLAAETGVVGPNLVREPVVLAHEERVQRRQADLLVGPYVAGQEQHRVGVRRRVG